MPTHPADTRRKRWTLRSTEPAGRAPLVERVLAARGLGDPEQTTAFLDCTLMHLHDPADLPDADRACARLIRAMRDGEPIVIYGDYDVDGITATAILYHTITHLDPKAQVSCYVPHRLDEGYGLNADALRGMAGDGCRVVISVDCGITAVEEAEVAGKLGIDLIITDHHNPRSDGVLPRPYALVHPRLPGSGYPFGELCGAGVAYKLAWRLAVMHADQPDGRARESSRALLVDLLAFAALGSIADMVPLNDENRVLTRYGLSRVRGSRFVGLQALVAASGLDSSKIDADDVGFRLAPRLNACGRMGHAADAVELFTSAAGARATELAEQLHQQNLQRQATERAITDQACAMAEAAGMTGDDRRAIVLSHADWHPGVVGIVCSRLVDRYARPTVLLCDDGRQAKGSGRSIPGFNLHAALESNHRFLTKFGGHDAAAGLTMDSSRVEEFAECFIEHVGGLLTPDDLVTDLRADCEAALHELTEQAVGSLDRLKPFGRGNPKVRLLVRRAEVSRAEVFGAQGRHLALQLRSPEHDAFGSLRCIRWNAGATRDQLIRGQRIDAILTPSISGFSGRVEPLIEDWRPAQR